MRSALLATAVGLTVGAFSATGASAAPINGQAIVDAGFQTSIVEEAIMRHLSGATASSPLLDAEQRRKILEPYLGLGERLGIGRSQEDIDASVREMRGER